MKSTLLVVILLALVLASPAFQSPYHHDGVAADADDMADADTVIINDDEDNETANETEDVLSFLSPLDKNGDSMEDPESEYSNAREENPASQLLWAVKDLTESVNLLMGVASSLDVSDMRTILANPLGNAIFVLNQQMPVVDKRIIINMEGSDNIRGELFNLFVELDSMDGMLSYLVNSENRKNMPVSFDRLSRFKTKLVDSLVENKFVTVVESDVIGH